MDIKQAQRAEQRLLLTQTMRQSLEILQMALPELREYIQDQSSLFLPYPVVLLCFSQGKVYLKGMVKAITNTTKEPQTKQA